MTESNNLSVLKGFSIILGKYFGNFYHKNKINNIHPSAIVHKTAKIGNNVKIGNYVKIQNNVSVYEGVEFEDYVFCGPSMVFTNIKLPRSEFPQRGSKYYLKTLVKKSLDTLHSKGSEKAIAREKFIKGAKELNDVPELISSKLWNKTFSG